MRRLVALAMTLSACGPAVIWSGRSADRRQRIEVIERAGLDYVVIDGVRRAAYHGIAGWSLALVGAHLAFAARIDDRWQVVVDGHPGPRWDRIGSLQLATDGTVTYAARRDHAWHVVHGSHIGPPFDAILADTIHVEGGHVAYVGSHANQVQLVHDDARGPWFDGIGQLKLSSDGTRTIYAGRRGADAHVVVDGVVGPVWGAVGKVTLGPGRHWAHAASDGDGWRLVVDGEVGPVVDEIRRIEFRDDAAHVAWVARIGGMNVLAVDDQPIGTLGARPQLAFRPHAHDATAHELAYVVDDARGQHVMIDDQAGPVYDEIGTLVWSSSGRLAYAARRGASWSVVIDGTDVAAGSHVGTPVFSADGAHVGFVAVHGKTTHVVVDDAVARFDLAFEDSLTFSSDNRHWAVIAGDVAHEQLFIAIDGKRAVELPTHDIYSAAAAGDSSALRAWTSAELARAMQSPLR